MGKKYVMAAALAAVSLVIITGLGGCALIDKVRRTDEYIPGETDEVSTDVLSSEAEAALTVSGTDGGNEEPLISFVGDDIVQTEDETGDFFIVPDTEMTESYFDQTEPYDVHTETEEQTETESEMPEDNGLTGAVLSGVITPRESLGEHWSFAYEDLESGDSYGYQEDDVMQSASVVKLFIMGAVYRYMCYPTSDYELVNFNEEYEGQLRDTITSMITVSDNSAANLLVERLGNGDFQAGAEKVNTFCRDNGYTGTSLGRMFMESDPSGDNYTTAADTRKFLSDIYHGTLINAEASGKMLEYLKNQTLKNKIPAGLPDGFTSANKTGEMPEGYGLGCIENDAAIVFAPEGLGEGYILTVLSNDLGGRNSEAISAIADISSIAAQWYTRHLSG